MLLTDNARGATGNERIHRCLSSRAARARCVCRGARVCASSGRASLFLLMLSSSSFFRCRLLRHHSAARARCDCSNFGKVGPTVDLKNLVCNLCVCVCVCFFFFFFSVKCKRCESCRRLEDARQLGRVESARLARRERSRSTHCRCQCCIIAVAQVLRVWSSV